MTKYLSTKQVAGQLGLSTDTIRKMVKQGKLHPLRLGSPNSPFRFDPDVLQADLQRLSGEHFKSLTPSEREIAEEQIAYKAALYSLRHGSRADLARRSNGG